MESSSLLAILDFGRARLLGSLDAIEKSGNNISDVLLWRPAPTRAHIAWQALHCAATHDKYLNVLIKGEAKPTDMLLVESYGGGSTPTDDMVPSLAHIRSMLQSHFTTLREYVAKLTPADLDRVIGPPDRQRKLGEAIILLAWHEAHHQGQLHLTWNLYRQAHQMD